MVLYGRTTSYSDNTVHLNWSIYAAVETHLRNTTLLGRFQRHTGRTNICNTQYYK